MESELNQQIRRPITMDDVWAFVRQRIERQQAAKKRFTLQFEVSVDAEGRVSNVMYQPVKERIET